MDVLISGASIAGPALAYWLGRFGFRPDRSWRSRRRCAPAATRWTSAAHCISACCGGWACWTTCAKVRTGGYGDALRRRATASG